MPSWPHCRGPEKHGERYGARVTCAIKMPMMSTSGRSGTRAEDRNAPCVTLAPRAPQDQHRTAHLKPRVARALTVSSPLQRSPCPPPGTSCPTWSLSRKVERVTTIRVGQVEPAPCCEYGESRRREAVACAYLTPTVPLLPTVYPQSRVRYMLGTVGRFTRPMLAREPACCPWNQCGVGAASLVRLCCCNVCCVMAAARGHSRLQACTGHFHAVQGDCLRTQCFI